MMNRNHCSNLLIALMMLLLTPVAVFALDPPTAVTAAGASGSSVMVSWTASASAEAIGYHVYYGTDSSQIDQRANAFLVTFQVDGQWQFEVRGLEKGITYYFAVAAVDENGAASTIAPVDGSCRWTLVPSYLKRVLESPHQINQPSGIALNGNSTTAYVSSPYNSCLLTIDLAAATPSTVGQITLPSNPFAAEPTAMAFNPMRNEIYAVDWAYGNNAVFVVDTLNDSVAAAPITVGDEPQNVIVSPDGDKAYVATIASDGVSVIDTATRQVTATIPLGEDGDPFGMAIAAGKLYVVGTWSGKVYVIDIDPSSAAVNTVIDTICVGDCTYSASPYGAVARPDGAFVYISHNTTEGVVTVIDTATDSVSRTITVRGTGETADKNPQGMAVDGNLLYVLNWGDNTITLIDTAANSRLELAAPLASRGGGIGAGSRPETLALSPDGTNLYIVHGGDAGSVEILGYPDPDSDDDGMDDDWETTHFGGLTADGTSDADSDGLTDLQEHDHYLDPHLADTDGDHIPDGWELDNGLNPRWDDASQDPDTDRFTNGREYQDDTDPMDGTSHRFFPHPSGISPDTGQTASHTETAGEDADYTIDAPYFVKMDAQGNYLADAAASWQMVYDAVSGLVWEVKNPSDGAADYASPNDADNAYTWYDADPIANGGNAGTAGDGTDTTDFIEALNAANYGGYSDWRMPTVQELGTLTDYGYAAPAVDPAYFPHTTAFGYWSSTVSASDANLAFTLSYQTGQNAAVDKTTAAPARAVRGPKIQQDGRYVDNGDGTVTDKATGLMWQQSFDANPYSWEDAIFTSENLVLAGHSDWRLPTHREVNTLVDFSSHAPAIDTFFFPGVDAATPPFWSSTTVSESTSAAWGKNFTDGSDVTADKLAVSHQVRSVRGGQAQITGRLFVESPSRTQRWEVGATVTITWDTAGIAGDVRISLSRDGGSTFETITSSTPNNGSHAWTVDGQISPNCMLKIEPLDNPELGTVQGLFTIGAPQPPTAVLTGTPADPTQATGASVTVGGGGVLNYRYRLDSGEYSGQHPVTETIVLSDLGDGPHTLFVCGRDAAGEWQPADAATTFSWLVDTTGPQAAAAPAGGYYAQNQPVELTCSDGPGSGCAAIYYTVDGSPPISGSNPYQASSPIAIDVDQTLNFFAVDAAGNAGPVVTETYFVDLTNPQVGIASPPDGERARPVSSIDGTAGDAGSGVASVQVLIQHGTSYIDPESGTFESPVWVTPVTADNWQTWSLATHQVGVWELGESYTITAKATDHAGNAETATITFTYADPFLPSAITSGVSRTEMTVGEPVTVSGQIDATLDAGGAFVDVIVTSPSGAEAHIPAVANVDGLFSVDLACGTIDRAGAWTIETHWNGNDVYESCTSPPHTLNVFKAKTELTIGTGDQSIIAGDTLAINGRLTPQPFCGQILPGQTVTLTITDPSDAPATVIIPNEGGNLYSTGQFTLPSYAFNDLGYYTLKADFLGNDAYEASASAETTVYVRQNVGYAIIVQGKVDNEEGLADHTKTTDHVYQVFRNRGFTDQDINYLTYPIGETPSKIEVQNAITQWAWERMDNRSPYPGKPATLFIVLVNHGSENAFHMGSEVITPAELNQWIGALEGSLAGSTAEGQKIVVMLGFCHSGSFIESLSANNRVVISSAAADEKSHRGTTKDIAQNRQGEYFVAEFFKEADSGKNLRECFVQATDRTESKYWSPNANSVKWPHFDWAKQHPLIDDDGDGIGSNKLKKKRGDGLVAETLFVGVNTEMTNPGNALIARVAPTRFLDAGESAVYLWADIAGTIPDAIWLEVQQPDQPELTGADGQIYLDLDRYDLAPGTGVRYGYDTNGDQVLEQIVDFEQPGIYPIFYLTEHDGEVAPFTLGLVYKQRSPDNPPPDAFDLTAPADAAEVPTTVVLDWEDTTDPEDEPVTYTVLIAKSAADLADPYADDKDVIRKPLLFSSTCLVGPEDGILDLTTYYWKVQAIDIYGTRTDSTSVRSFSTNNTNAVVALMGGYIVQAGSHSPVPNATVTISGITKQTDDSGYFLGNFDVGPETFTVEAYAAGFATASQEVFLEPDGELHEANFLLFTAAPGDVDGINGLTLTDAVIAMKALAGIEAIGEIREDYAIAGVDVNGDFAVGMEDVVYILQRLAGVRE